MLIIATEKYRLDIRYDLVEKYNGVIRVDISNVLNLEELCEVPITAFGDSLKHCLNGNWDPKEIDAAVEKILAKLEQIAEWQAMYDKLNEADEIISKVYASLKNKAYPEDSNFVLGNYINHIKIDIVTAMEIVNEKISC